MLNYRGQGIGSFYYSLLRDLLTNGIRTCPRGHTCITMPEPVVLVYEEPGACLMYIPGRKFNIFFALMEALWILAGSGDVDWICFFNENMRQFSDLGHLEFHGAYGLRMRHWNSRYREAWDNERLVITEVDQIQAAASKIMGDPDTRQAVISLWDPARDNIDVSRDYPCNNVVYLTQSNGVLDLTVVIRSNDIVWGTPHNAIQFTYLLALLAGITRLKMGKIIYFVNVLHVYNDDLYKDTFELLKYRSVSGDPGAYMIPFFEPTTDPEIQSTFKIVTDIAKFQGQYISPNTPKSLWADLLPYMAGIYAKIRHDKCVHAKTLANFILGIPFPIPDLITDFYLDSKNPVANEVARVCQKTLKGHSKS